MCTPPGWNAIVALSYIASHKIHIQYYLVDEDTTAKEKEYLITDYLNSEDMLITATLDLFNHFPNHTVYVHNLTSFDSLFLLKIFKKNFNCKPIFKDNRAIHLKIFNFIYFL